MRALLIAALVGIPFIAGIGLIAACVYIRCFVISTDGFDPWRLTSVDCLGASCICFITTAAASAIAREF
jgi:hypothetical protein